MNACSRTALSNVSGASSDVMTTTRGARSTLRSAASKSRPVIRGIQTSRSIRSKRSLRIVSSASTPSLASDTEWPALASALWNDEPGRVVVINYQDSAHGRLCFLRGSSAECGEATRRCGRGASRAATNAGRAAVMCVQSEEYADRAPSKSASPRELLERRCCLPARPTSRQWRSPLSARAPPSSTLRRRFRSNASSMRR